MRWTGREAITALLMREVEPCIWFCKLSDMEKMAKTISTLRQNAKFDIALIPKRRTWTITSATPTSTCSASLIQSHIASSIKPNISFDTQTSSCRWINWPTLKPATHLPQSWQTPSTLEILLLDRAIHSSGATKPTKPTRETACTQEVVPEARSLSHHHELPWSECSGHCTPKGCQSVRECRVEPAIACLPCQPRNDSPKWQRCMAHKRGSGMTGSKLHPSWYA